MLAHRIDCDMNRGVCRMGRDMNPGPAHGSASYHTDEAKRQSYVRLILKSKLCLTTVLSNDFQAQLCLTQGLAIRFTLKFNYASHQCSAMHPLLYAFPTQRISHALLRAQSCLTQGLATLRPKFNYASQQCSDILYCISKP